MHPRGGGWEGARHVRWARRGEPSTAVVQVWEGGDGWQGVEGARTADSVDDVSRQRVPREDGGDLARRGAEGGGGHGVVRDGELVEELDECDEATWAHGVAGWVRRPEAWAHAHGVAAWVRRVAGPGARAWGCSLGAQARSLGACAWGCSLGAQGCGPGRTQAAAHYDDEQVARAHALACHGVEQLAHAQHERLRGRIRARARARATVRARARARARAHRVAELGQGLGLTA